MTYKPEQFSTQTWEPAKPIDPELGWRRCSAGCGAGAAFTILGAKWGYAGRDVPRRSSRNLCAPCAALLPAALRPKAAT